MDREIRRALLGDRAAQKRLTDQYKLIPCICGGDIEETGALCNYAKKTITLNLKCKKCGTTVRFKTIFQDNPIYDAFLAWNTRAPILSAEELEAIDGKL